MRLLATVLLMLGIAHTCFGQEQGHAPENRLDKAPEVEVQILWLRTDAAPKPNAPPLALPVELIGKLRAAGMANIALEDYVVVRTVAAPGAIFYVSNSKQYGTFQEGYQIGINCRGSFNSGELIQLRIDASRRIEVERASPQSVVETQVRVRPGQSVIVSRNTTEAFIVSMQPVP